MLYPLRFEPLFQQYIWGGRRLKTLLGKPLGEGPTYAESWEVVDHGEHQSVVADGPLAGQTLHQIVTDHGPELFGRHHPQRQFPLLFKFLDAERTLSVQVHPNDEQGAQLDPPDLGKTEAWVVLTAEPGSKIYAGLKPGVDRQRLATAIEEGRCEECLHEFEPQVGDCVFIAAGTVHALGEGLVIAEIQQASNTTFRLFDWNRVGPDGQPRPLHIAQSLSTIDYARGPVAPQQPQPLENPHGSRLVECDKFLLDRWESTEPVTCDLGDRFRMVSVINGTMDLRWQDQKFPLQKGNTMLLPAICSQVELLPQGSCQWLEMHLPA